MSKKASKSTSKASKPGIKIPDDRWYHHGDAWSLPDGLWTCRNSKFDPHVRVSGLADLPPADLAAVLALLKDRFDILPSEAKKYTAEQLRAMLATQGETGASKIDDPATVALTPNEQAFFDVLTDEGQIAKDLVGKLTRQGIRKIDETAISKMSKKPKLVARGVRHESGAGYYRIQVNAKLTPS